MTDFCRARSQRKEAGGFVEQEQQTAQQQAIDELVAKRSAELLDLSPKALYLQKGAGELRKIRGRFTGLTDRR